MTDYNQTRDFAGVVTSRFTNMLRNLSDDFEEEIVVQNLMNYYNLVDKSDEDLLWAIDRVLQDFMTTKDYNDWLKSCGDKTPHSPQKMRPTRNTNTQKTEKEMNVSDVVNNVMGTSAAVEIMNELVLATLKSSREACVEMRMLLEAKRDKSGHLTDAEVIDWECLVLDIAALDRAIDYYGG